MRLVQPTDFDILEALSAGKRNNAVNIAAITEHDRSYINTRLPILADYGLIERVGPASNSGLYVITELGKSAAENRDKYSKSKDNFERLLNEM
jgi:predicted transcriptional regulator